MDIDERPKLKLKKTPLEMMLDGIAFILLIGSIVYLIAVWTSLPSEVPAHYNVAGEVDRWGKKWEMVIIPLNAFALWIGMSILEKYPHVFNYMNLSKENIEAQYVNARQMLNVVKNITTAIFAYITWKDIQIALGNDDSLSTLFTPLFFILVFGPIIYFIIRSFRI